MSARSTSYTAWWETVGRSARTRRDHRVGVDVGMVLHRREHRQPGPGHAQRGAPQNGPAVRVRHAVIMEPLSGTNQELTCPPAPALLGHRGGPVWTDRWVPGGRRFSRAAGAGTSRGMRELPLRVAVLSPQAIVAEGLRAILATLREHAELVPLDSQAPDPDVVLYDAIGLLRGDATDLDILVNKTTSTVLVVSHDLRPGLAAEALAAGADGHISLAAGPAEILAALDSAATGWRLGDDGDSPVIGSEDSETGRDLLGGSLGLSRREAQMLTLIGDGSSNSEIAAELYLSPNTVKTYIRAAYRKIGATNRAQATSWAITHGFAAG